MMDGLKLLAATIIAVWLLWWTVRLISEILEFGSWRSLMDELTDEQEKSFLNTLNHIANINRAKKEREKGKERKP